MSLRNNERNIHDYEYISNDPEENNDNFDPKWSYLRELRTDEERYQAIRKRWGNKEIPDPRINLSYRNPNNESENGDKNLEAKPVQEEKHPTVERRRNRQVSRRRSRSCTRPYEKLISELEKNYRLEYSQLMYKHSAELHEMLQIQFSNYNIYNRNANVFNLLSSQQMEVKSFLGEKTENLETCVRYLEEVKDFFTFYQKINDDEVTLQLTDEQYEHNCETEKMYEFYKMYYR